MIIAICYLLGMVMGIISGLARGVGPTGFASEMLRRVS